ncbi:uncharacterized protein SCODWIG_03979 [Saccharomycodes ludwigii]|uniref:Agglutinin-like protein N-terminal domain-containing protein n=1 Tax=Saccharomycodes ludwigii TaxID=36035 RepID=A0A376BC68_9ASCO|nr:uncharacterized protein SCODWIG_03979 [Saccharomycodes ludwigii]
MFLHLLFVLLITCTNATSEILAITFSDLSFSPQGAKYPEESWTATFNFAIDAGIPIDIGDYFTVSMPHIYRLKIGDDEGSFDVRLSDGTNAFRCYAYQQAAYLYEDTILACESYNSFTSANMVTGSISVSLIFSNGDSYYKYELQNANFFQADTPQNVLFGDELSANITFDSLGENNEMYYFARTTTYGTLESYTLGHACPNGYILGGTEILTYDINNENNGIDCDNSQVGLTSNFNDWLFPIDYLEVDYDCGNNIIEITVGPLDNGVRIWANNLQKLPNENNTIHNRYSILYTCTDTIASTQYIINTATDQIILITQDLNTGSASIITKTAELTTTITTPGSLSYTTTYATNVWTSTGTDGVPTTSTIIYVETPEASGTTTTDRKSVV